MKLLRPLKTVRFIPALRRYLEALYASSEAFFVNGLIMSVVIMALAFMTHAMIQDDMRFRCVPVDFNNSAVLSDVYYQTYGADYFYSRFNDAFCST
jgi:hypothetical protein